MVDPCCFFLVVRSLFKQIMEEIIDLVSNDSDGDAERALYKLSWQGPPKTWLRPKSYVKKLPFSYMKSMVDPNKERKKFIYDTAKQQLRNDYNVVVLPVFAAEKAVVFEIEFYRKLPNDAFVNSMFGTKLKPKYMCHGTNRADIMCPDLDNLVKLVKDSLQGIAYKDDKQVAAIHAYKMLHLEPPFQGRTIVWVRECHGLDFPPSETQQGRNIDGKGSMASRILGNK